MTDKNEPKLTDITGEALPCDYDTDWAVRVELSSLRGPEVVVTIPADFYTDKWSYCGDGLSSVPLRDVLQDYYDTYMAVDDGELLLPLATLLREFAEKYESANRHITS